MLERLAACDWTEEKRYDASPSALGVVMRSLTEGERKSAFAPPPTILPVTDILFDAWALTTIRDNLPGRPRVEPYLHGLADWQPPETQVAWREEVRRLQPKYKDDAEQAESETEDRRRSPNSLPSLLEDYPLKPHELLREPSHRAFKQFEAMAKRRPDLPVWLLDDDGKVTGADGRGSRRQGDEGTDRGHDHPSAAVRRWPGRRHAQRSAAAPGTGSLDVADEWYADKEKTVRHGVRLDENDPPDGMRLIRRVPLPGGSEETEPEYWYWFELGNEGGTSAKQPVEWCVHVKDVERSYGRDRGQTAARRRAAAGVEAGREVP